MSDPLFEGMTDQEVDVAKSAECSRCQVKIVGSPSMVGTVMVSYYLPALSVRRRGMLCGACGIAFREFLAPGLADDAVFQTVKSALLAEW